MELLRCHVIPDREHVAARIYEKAEFRFFSKVFRLVCNRAQCGSKGTQITLGFWKRSAELLVEHEQWRVVGKCERGSNQASIQHFTESCCDVYRELVSLGDELEIGQLAERPVFRQKPRSVVAEQGQGGGNAIPCLRKPPLLLPVESVSDCRCGECNIRRRKPCNPFCDSCCWTGQRELREWTVRLLL